MCSTTDAYPTGQLVELQGGRIWADSEYDKGSTFFFTLPRQNAGKAKG